MSFCTTRHVKSSRKIKDCYWCGQMILVGNPKVYISTLIEGDFSDVNLHPECFDASNRWQDRNKFEDSWPEWATMERGTTKTKWEVTDEYHNMMNAPQIYSHAHKTI